MLRCNSGREKWEQSWRLVDMDDQKLIAILDQQRLSDGAQEEMETHLEVVLMMKKLPSEDRLLLEGWYLQGRSAEALAEALGCKPDSVRSKLSRARKRALKILRGKEG